MCHTLVCGKLKFGLGVHLLLVYLISLLESLVYIVGLGGSKWRFKLTLHLN
jgi:hypothetical protein